MTTVIIIHGEVWLSITQEELRGGGLDQLKISLSLVEIPIIVFIAYAAGWMQLSPCMLFF